MRYPASMVSIALIVLGVVFGAVGLAISGLPLVAVGALWIVCGLISRAFAARVKRTRKREPSTATTGAVIAGDPTSQGPSPLATMLVLTATTLTTGLSAVAVGLFSLGFDAAHLQWRWLPLIAGIGPAALGIIAITMYGIGSAAKATLGEPPTVPATIVIRAVRDTDVYVNDKPRLEFELDVRPDGRQPYQVTKRATVPFAAMGHVQVGHGFHATVAGPEDPANMDIDWASGFDEGDADPAERLRQLDRLRGQGLITDAEYASQRARIIGSV